MNVRGLFRFPDPVNETSARLVAAGVVAQAIVLLVVREWWVLVPLTYGFVARVATGPTLSPLGQIVTRAVTPALERAVRRRRPGFDSRQVPGRPKRFAQAIGVAVTVSASVAWALGVPGLALGLVALLAVAATLEAVFALCLGCIAYSAIWGCADCDDISDRLRRALVESREQAAADASTITPSTADAASLTPSTADAASLTPMAADAASLTPMAADAAAMR